MKKTLNELLHDNKYQKTNVKIGAKSGSGFFYCGKGTLSVSINEIKKAREITLKQIKGYLYQAKYRLEHLDKIYADNIEKMRKKVKDFDKYVKQMAIKKERDKIFLPKRIASLEYDITIDLLDRPVLEIVEGISPDEKPCWIIYIKGNERGAYWTIAEYNKRRRTNGVNI